MRRFVEDFKKAFEQVDVLISPTSPSTAFKFGEKMDDPLAMYTADRQSNIYRSLHGR